MAPIYRIPEDVLSEIFFYVIYTPSIPLAGLRYSMGDTLIDIYRSLHTLLGVCSKWRALALARGSFWSTVPIMEPIYPLYHGEFTTRHPCSTSHSLERAGGGDLHLAVVLPDLTVDGTYDLTKFAPRFRTVNISSKSHSVIDHILSYFRGPGSSNRLTDLSIFFETSEFNQVPQESDYVFRSGDPKQQLFESLIKSLSVLRVRGVMFHLETALSSSRLVELHLQELTLGHDSKLAELLKTLSSVTGLRHLKLISIKTFPDNGFPPTQPPTASSGISLPSLQTLLIQDLHANTLQLLLSFVSSRTHTLTLHLTEKCLQVRHPGVAQPDVVGIQGWVGLSGCQSVAILMIEGKTWNWMPVEDLQKTLTYTHNLETLQMCGWRYSEEYCKALTRPQNSDSRAFPRIKNIHFFGSTISDTDSFASMVASHSGSLESMVLGAGIEKDTYGEMEWEDLEEDDEVVICLGRNVPKFEHICWAWDPPEFERKPEWLLW
ncbi:hypothetical protein FRC11_003321 [Ceratobasidium sp. 423]|nr:hypothetical protein FRC11_003321 [Ceratobasidium sp. 423]